MTRRVLVVDDDEFMVRTLSDVLQLEGWEVTCARSGKVAVDSVRDHAYDVVLMDIKMPGMDGVQAFRAMKAARPSIRVILMTAFAAADRIDEARLEGVVSVLSKPVSPEQLLAMLGQFVSSDRPVLVIDSDAAFLRTLAESLAVQGFDAIVAPDLDHAIRLLRERCPASVLLHMHVGATTVQQAISRVHEECPDAALIVYSGQPEGEAEIHETVPPSWVTSYLQKPFPIDEVTRVLNELARRD